jgi:hypothetical protein
MPSDKLSNSERYEQPSSDPSRTARAQRMDVGLLRQVLASVARRLRSAHDPIVLASVARRLRSAHDPMGR